MTNTQLESQTAQSSRTQLGSSSVASLVGVHTHRRSREEYVCGKHRGRPFNSHNAMPCAVLVAIAPSAVDRRQTQRTPAWVPAAANDSCFYDYETLAKGHFRFSICVAASPLPESFGDPAPPPLALVHVKSTGLITESKAGRSRSENCDAGYSDEEMQVKADQGRLFSSKNAMS